MATRTYQVEGMTCQHCVDAVTKEVSSLPTVTGVSVELETGMVNVTSDADLADVDVAAAITDAGYALV